MLGFHRNDTGVETDGTSLLKSIADSEHTQKALLRDLVLLSCFLETPSQYLHVDTNIVNDWRLRFDKFFQHPVNTYIDEQEALQFALLCRVLGASGGETGEATEGVLCKSTLGQNLGALSSLLGGHGRYHGTESDPKTISTALVGHHLFQDQDILPTAIEVRLGELRRYVPIAYPDIVRKPFERVIRLATDYRQGLPRIALIDMTIEHMQVFRAYMIQMYREFPSLDTEGNNRWLFLICPALDTRIGSLVKFAQTRIGFQTFFQQAVDQVLQGQGLEQLVLCLLVMLRYQELVSPDPKPSKPPPNRSVAEDFCTLMGQPKLVPLIRTSVGLMVRSLQRVSITRARDNLGDFIVGTINIDAYPDIPDKTADAFWSSYIDKKDINAAICQTIGNGDANSSYKGQLIPNDLRGGLDYGFKYNVDNSIREQTLQRYLPIDLGTPYRTVSFSSMLAFARLVGCQSLLEEVQAHVPADDGFRFVPTARRILHCDSIPEWSFDLQEWSATLCRWRVTEIPSSGLLDLAGAYSLGEILSWNKNTAMWHGARSAFMVGWLENRAIIFNSIEHDWFHICAVQHVERLNALQTILGALSNRSKANSKRPSLRRQALKRCGIRALHSRRT